MNKENLWVLMSELPLNYWCEEVLTSIGNCIGIFLALVDNFWYLVDKMLDRVLVEVDIRDVIPVELEIK